MVSFQGLHHDTATGLVYNRARMLNPILGRFMQRDPMGYVGSANLYGYVNSNSVNLVDPLGLYPGETYVNATGSALAEAGSEIADLGGAARDAAASTASGLADRVRSAPEDFARAGQELADLGTGVYAVGKYHLGLGSRREMGREWLPVYRRTRHTGDRLRALKDKALNEGRKLKCVLQSGDAEKIGDYSTGLGISLLQQAASRGRGTNLLRRNPAAGARPHTAFRRNPDTGRIDNYETYDSSGAAGGNKRFRGTGRPHGGQDPSLILEPKPGHPDATPNRARPARPDELPQGY
jgi:RHS repeat-associated protein